MKEQPSLIQANLLSYVGLQVVFLGLMMFGIGVIFGTVWTGEAAWASIVASAPPGASIEPPAYLQMASAINLWAVALASVSLLALLGLDWVGQDEV